MTSHSQSDRSRPNLAAAVASRVERNDRGEGVISMAIAILIIAFIGALMFVGLNTMWQDTEAKTTTQLDSIGGSIDG